MSMVKENNLDKMLLPDLAKEIEEKLILDTSSTRSPTDLGLITTRSKVITSQPNYGLQNTAYVYQKAMRSILSSLLEKSSNQLPIKDTIATACRAAPIFDTYPDSDDEGDTHLDDRMDLIVTVTPQGRRVF